MYIIYTCLIPTTVAHTVQFERMPHTKLFDNEFSRQKPLSNQDKRENSSLNKTQLTLLSHYHYIY